MSIFNIRWYDKPEQIKIALRPNEAKLHPLGHDVFIIKYIDGQRFDALVPTWTMSDNLESVPAAAVGEVDDKVILYFPVSNEGRPCWEITKQQLDAIKVA